MKKLTLFLAGFLLVASIYFTAAAQSTPQGTPVAAPGKITENVMSLLVYKRDHLRFSEEFTAFDASGQSVSKKEFLELMGTGKYVPLAFAPQAGKRTYQLKAIPAGADKDIRVVLGQWGKMYGDQYSREGQVLPPMDFVDLKGRRYSSDNTRGKIVVIKCWFIHCQACVQEMPKLNRLVEQYRNRKDIIFVSLASDSKDKLTEFLKKTEFSYAVVPGMDDYMSNKLRVSSYPTHFIINKEGKISKMVGDANELIVSLHNEAKE